MVLSVGYFKTLSVKTQKLVIVFEQYNINNKISTLEIPDHDILPSKWHHVLTDVPFPSVLDLKYLGVFK